MITFPSPESALTTVAAESVPATTAAVRITDTNFLFIKNSSLFKAFFTVFSLMMILYHFVVTTAMLTRYCIDGGLEPEQAYRLSDFYILKMDSCTSVREVADLHHIMAKDFTGKMLLQKKSSVLSKPVIECINYIYSHIKERITIQDLAEHTGLSCNYLSRIFKQNLGVSISDYIREQKIEKATHLLRYSDQSIVDIAAYLSFSSQSHFIQIFEGYIGLTPKKYRDKYYKSMW